MGVPDGHAALAAVVLRSAAVDRPADTGLFGDIGTYRGSWRRELLRLEARIRHSEAWNRLKDEVAKYRDLDLGDPSDALKYLKIDALLPTNILRAIRLHLHRHPPLRILDIGCGTGLFCYVCSFLGHEAAGLDKPLAECSRAEQIVYGLVPKVLGIKVCRQAIRKYVPTRLDQSYDLVTAFQICFNRHKQPDEWGSEEWAFFICDICRHIRPAGRMALVFNPNCERFGELCYYDARTAALFRRWGQVESAEMAIIRRDRVLGR